MKWVKHMTASWDDERIAKLVHQAPGRSPDRSLAAYGLYWRVQEIIAASMEGVDPPCSVQYHVSRWASLLGLRASDVHRQLNGLAVAGLSLVDRIDMDIRVTNRNLLKYRDEYARKSGHAPDKAPLEVEAEVEADKKKEKEKVLKATPPTVTLPAWVPPDSWDSFVEMRKRIRAPLTADAITLTIRSLEKLKNQGHDPRAVLEQSVERAWRGVFQIKQESGNGRLQSPAIERQARNFNAYQQAMVDSGDYSLGQDDGQNHGLLPEPRAK